MNFLMTDARIKAVETFQTSGQILPHVRKAFNQQISRNVLPRMVNVIETNQPQGELYDSCIYFAHMIKVMESNQL